MPFDPNAPSESGSGVFGLHEDLGTAAVELIPVPIDATASYGTGSSAGPDAIREASHQVDLEDDQFGGFWPAGMVMREPDLRVTQINTRLRELVAAARTGDSTVLGEINRLGEEYTVLVRTRCESAIAAGRVPGVIGGEHAVSLGAMAAAAAAGPLGVLHIDAHFDLREAYEGFTHSHASVMFNAVDRIPSIERVVSVGVRDFCVEERDRAHALGDRWVSHTDRTMSRRLAGGERFGVIAAEIASALPDRVYITMDIDGLDPALCPGTGTPVPGGLSFAHWCALLDALSAAGKTIAGFDLVEVAPHPALGEWDANVGARVLFKLCGLAIRSR